MRASGIVVTAAVVLLAAAAGAQSVQQQASTKKGEVEAARLVEVEATIVAIDLATREIKLRTREGKELPIIAGPEVQRLADLRVGDVVEIQLYESLTLSLSKVEGDATGRSEVSREQRTEPSELPGGIKTRQTTVVAKVTAVDTAASEVTVEGPDAKPVTLEADPEVLQGVKVGDFVTAVYTEAVAVSVSRPPAH
jgi:hypothetical protein